MNQDSDTSRELEIRRRLKADFKHYAPRSLKIRDKGGKTVPFSLNPAQEIIHERLERQRAETGKVRAIILKGRQQGCSTYVEGRFYWRTTWQKGVKAFILTHLDDATKHIFEMVKFYHDNCHPLVRPSTSASSAKELIFDQLGSGYAVGTAGNKSVGRSMTNQLFHGSEVAFWQHAGEHVKGVMQTVPDEPGTEIILESTANGVGGYFHEQWKMAEAGIGDFIAIFIPWFLQPEYRKPIDADFRMTDEEHKLVEYYKLDAEQINWRRNKIISLSVDGADGAKAFMQEYPMNAAEAFQVSGGDGLIKADVVMRARKNKANPSGPLLVGVDPSRGGDRFSVIKRAGRKMYGMQKFSGDQCNTLGKNVAICKTILDQVCPVAGKKPDMMFIDAGFGADLVDRLHELGYQDRVKAIAFGASPLNPQKYTNRRNEMWGDMNAWLCDENLPAEIPDSDDIQADLCASPFETDSNNRRCLWPKKRIKAEYGFSPDLGDAGALTFAEPVVEKKTDWDDVPIGAHGGWMAG